jgi:hypothetical protein
MKRYIVGGAFAAVAAAAALVVPSAASALTYTSYLEYKNSDPSTKVDPFGVVTLTEGAGYVDVVVHLYDPQVGFVNTGAQNQNKNKAPFSFNLTGDYGVTTLNEVAGQQFYDGGFGSFENSPFGDFTNIIGCCGDVQGGGAYDPTDLHFTVSFAGLTFAGDGAVIENGKLISLGTGPHFLSNSDGWWFAADVVTNTGSTFSIGARDAYTDIPEIPGRPEPATWALMIMGFGCAGAILRRRRVAFA